jgi:hypothetical protein
MIASTNSDTLPREDLCAAGEMARVKGCSVSRHESRTRDLKVLYLPALSQPPLILFLEQ